MGFLEIVGFAASIIVAISLMMSNIWRLRWFNLIGAVFFVIYGVAIKAWPVVGVNGFIAIIDAYYLIQMSKKSEFFSILHVDKNELMVSKFLEMYQKDISHFFPEFQWELLNNPKCIFTMRNLNPVGLVVLEEIKPGEALVKLDYVAQEYRDNKNGKFLFVDNKDELISKGIKSLLVLSGVQAHQRYLEKIGFKKIRDNFYRKDYE